MDDHEKTLIGLLKKNDPSKVSQAIIATCEKKGVRKSIHYKWERNKWEKAMYTAQMMCLDKVEWWKQNGFTVSPEEEKEINWYDWITNKLIEHQRLAEEWDGWSWTRKILEQGGAQEFLNYADQLANEDAAEADSLHESKKVNTKKHVIKEAVRRHARRIRK